MKYVAALLLLSSCFGQAGKLLGGDQAILCELPSSKQKQRIAHLQKKLEIAEKGKQKADDEVDRLKNEIQDTRLAMICKQIDAYEEQIHKLQDDPARYSLFLQREMSALFLKERESLHELIQSGSAGAQALLDRVLRLITELSDGTKNLK